MLLAVQSSFIANPVTAKHEANTAWMVGTLALYLHAGHMVILGPSLLLEFFWDAGIHQLHLALSFNPFHFNCTRKLSIKLSILLDILKKQ